MELRISMVWGQMSPQTLLNVRERNYMNDCFTINTGEGQDKVIVVGQVTKGHQTYNI